MKPHGQHPGSRLIDFSARVASSSALKLGRGLVAMYGTQGEVLISNEPSIKELERIQQKMNRAQIELDFHLAALGGAIQAHPGDRRWTSVPELFVRGKDGVLTPTVIQTGAAFTSVRIFESARPSRQHQHQHVLGVDQTRAYNLLKAIATGSTTSFDLTFNTSGQSTLGATLSDFARPSTALAPSAVTR